MDLHQVAAAARPLFERLQPQLIHDHANEFVAIEPDSAEFFLGKTLSEAIGCARAKFPERPVHTFRVGHEATIHFGMQVR
jgi:hypothetical protein